MTLHVYEFPCFLSCSLPNLMFFFSVNHCHHIINVKSCLGSQNNSVFYYHHRYTGCQRYGSQTTGLTNATWASMTGRRGRRLSLLQGMFFLPLCVSTNSYTASLHFQTKQTSFFFSPISLHTVFNVFVVKSGCWGGTWVTWRGTVQSQQVGQYDKDGKTGCGAGLQAGGKAFLITSVRFQVLCVVPEGRCFETGTVC